VFAAAGGGVVDDDAPIALADPPDQDVEIDSEAEEAAVEWVDESQGEVESPAGVAPSQPVPEIDWTEPKPKKARVGPKRATAPEPVTAPGVPAGMIVVPERRRRVGKRSIAFVLMALAVLIASTVGLNVWHRFRERLPQEAESALKGGEEALVAGQFDEAKRQLGRAARDFRLLGVTDERRVRAEQLAAEAAIAADLPTVNLADLVAEAARYEEKEWNARVKTFYRGRSLVLDDEIETSPNQGGEYRLRSRYVDGVPPVPARIGRIDLKGFKLIETRAPRVKDRVLFGARIESIDLVGGEWLIRLQPDSGVWMSHQPTIEALLAPSGEIE
jgi:hypothetical protein